jgi:hypothetical protein
MAASDYVPIFFKNRLHLAGRPQMSTRPRTVDCVPFVGRLSSRNGSRAVELATRKPGPATRSGKAVEVVAATISALTGHKNLGVLGCGETISI